MDKISPIKERILQYIDKQCISKVEFCEKTGISYSNMKGKSLESEIGGEKLSEILSVYSEISPDWLLTGIGSMFRPLDLMADQDINVQDKEVKDGKWQVSSATPHEFSYLIEKIQSLAAENALLKKENDELKQSRGKSIDTIPYSDISPKIGTSIAAEPTHK
jgi:hypothetical protein